MKRICLLMIILSNYALAQIKDIKLLEIVFMDNINYYSFYHKNTYMTKLILVKIFLSLQLILI